MTSTDRFIPVRDPGGDEGALYYVVDTLMQRVVRKFPTYQQARDDARKRTKELDAPLVQRHRR